MPLIDENGNYVLDKDGNMIFLAAEETPEERKAYIEGLKKLSTPTAMVLEYYDKDKRKRVTRHCFDHRFIIDTAKIANKWVNIIKNKEVG